MALGQLGTLRSPAAPRRRRDIPNQARDLRVWLDRRRLRAYPRTQHDFHIRDLDTCDAGRRGLRNSHSSVALDGGQLFISFSRNRRDHRVDDDQTASRPRRAPGKGVQLRLADLDRAPAALVRADGPGFGADRPSNDARGRRTPRRRHHSWGPVSSRDALPRAPSGRGPWREAAGERLLPPLRSAGNPSVRPRRALR